MSKFTKESKVTVGFWGPNEGAYGEYFVSKEIDAAMYDELQKVEIGGRLFLNTVNSENEKAPKFSVTIKPKFKTPNPGVSKGTLKSAPKRAAEADSDSL